MILYVMGLTYIFEFGWHIWPEPAACEICDYCERVADSKGQEHAGEKTNGWYKVFPDLSHFLFTHHADGNGKSGEDARN